MRRGAAVLGCLSALLLGVGCNEYKYVEVPVSFNPANLDSSQTGYIYQCWITVSGADSTQFRLKDGKCPKKPPGVAPLDVGVFEFATFADSGSLTFKLEAFMAPGMQQNCKLGEGSTTVPLTGATTITAMTPLVVSKVGDPAACSNVTPPTSDAGI
jgi:hypothetical protein